MRVLGVLVLGVIVSWAVAGVAQVGLGIVLDAREEMIIAMVAEVILALFVALVFGLVLALRGGRRAIAFAATAMVVLGIASLAGIEAFALADAAGTIDPSDLPLLLELGIPGVITVVLQWWLVRRYLKRQPFAVPVSVSVQG